MFISEYDLNLEFKDHLKKVFLWLVIGMFITASIASLCYISLQKHGIIESILSNPFIIIFIVIAELVCAFAIHKVIFKMNSKLCMILYLLYAALTGLTFSILPMAYGLDNIFMAFICTTVLFGVCAFMGYVLKIDMSKWVPYLLAALVILIILSICSIFIPVLRESLLISILGVILFSIYTAVDIQLIKRDFNEYRLKDESVINNFAIYGAFRLYIDFVNLFLDLLRIISKVKSKS